LTATYEVTEGERIPSGRPIYRLIDSGALEVKNIDLPQKMKRSAKGDSRPRGTNTQKLGRSLDERPEEVLTRQEVGHWEGDRLKGSKEKNEPARLT